MRYFIYLSFDGTRYHGWQAQPDDVSVQQVLEQCLFTFLRTPVQVVGAGRTDAGVHARCMVAHFDCPATLPAGDTLHKLNRLLPPDVAAFGLRPVPPDAHARFSALSRTYRYYISTRKDPFMRAYRWQVGYTLDFDLMNRAADALTRYTDFTSFSKLHTDVKTNNCRVSLARWTQLSESEWVFTIRADRFLRNMVRAVVGTLVEVGRGRMSLDEFHRVIMLRDRCRAGNSAPAQGLFLEEVEYPRFDEPLTI